MEDDLRKLALSDGRYSPEALRFLFESLSIAIELAGKDGAEGPERHVSGQEVLAGMREHAARSFGPLAAAVWRQWGVHKTIDWGRIVFMLVDAGMLNRQESDSVEDFADGFDYEQAFVEDYHLELPAEL